MNIERAIEFLENEINGDNYKAIEGIIELLQNGKGKPYERLEEFIQETYNIYDPGMAYAYNIGYIDALTDYTHNFTHYELNNLTFLNDQLRVE